MKNKRVIIIMIILIIVITLGLLVTFMAINNGNGQNSSDSGNKSNIFNSNKTDDDTITQIDLSLTLKIVALTKSGDLYAIGDNSYGWGGKSKLDKSTLLASNVKKFFSSGDYYIDNDGNLYCGGIKAIEGGTYDHYEKIGENVKDFAGQSLGFMVVTNDGELLAYGQKDYSGIGKECKELTKVEGASDVALVRSNISFRYYVTNSNELYAKPLSGTGSFEKILDGVEKASESTNFVQTKEGKVYKLDYDYKNKKVVANLYEDANGILDTSYKAFATKDGVILDDKTYSYEAERMYYPTDVKEMLYVNGATGFISDSNYSGEVYMYINNEGKFVFNLVKQKLGYVNEKTDEVKKELDYTQKSLNEMYDIISGKKY